MPLPVLLSVVSSVTAGSPTLDLAAIELRERTQPQLKAIEGVCGRCSADRFDSHGGRL
jgi:hypothetical protein